MKNSVQSIGDDFTLLVMDDKADKFTVAKFILNLCDHIMNIKGEMSNMIKQIKRKTQLIREEKLIFSKIETKSNDLKTLGEDLVT